MKKIEVDLSQVKNVVELHQVLKDKLGFPDFYGMNWNAFWDAITGLVEMPNKLVLLGWANIEEQIPSDAKVVTELLQDYNTEFKNWRCKVEYS